MKLSFSTVGCPDWSFDDILSIAKDIGYGGVEIRGIADQLDAPHMALFNAQNIDKTMKKLADTGMEIPVLCSNAALCVNGAEALAEAKGYIDLAARLGVPYVRVMPTPNPQPEQCDMQAGLAAYRELCEYGTDKKVTPLIETNGALADSAVMAAFIRDTGHENSGALWDINHTVRFFGESADDTMKNIGSLVKHVHLKDSIMENGKLVYKMPGSGDLPIRGCIAALEAAGYAGYYSFEWVKRWNPELTEPGVAFAHYYYYMTEEEAE